MVAELSVVECDSAESAVGRAAGNVNGPRLATLPLDDCLEESMPVRSWVEPVAPLLPAVVDPAILWSLLRK